MHYTFTPQTFYDIFILCFSWEERSNDLRSSYTTVDKVATILNRLGILSDKQKGAISKDKRTQSLFVMRSGFWGVAEGSLTELKNSQKNLIFRSDYTRDVNRERMMRNTHIFISAVGKAYATTIEQRYANVVTKEAYLGELARRDTEFKTGASRASASTNYRKRLAQELEEGV